MAAYPDPSVVGKGPEGRLRLPCALLRAQCPYTQPVSRCLPGSPHTSGMLCRSTEYRVPSTGAQAQTDTGGLGNFAVLHYRWGERHGRFRLKVGSAAALALLVAN